MQQALDIVKGLTGYRPLGWYTGRDSPNTRRLVVEQATCFTTRLLRRRPAAGTICRHRRRQTRDHLYVVPYTLDANDMRFATAQGFNSGEQFFQLPARQFRRALCRGRRHAEDDVGRPATYRLVGRYRFRALQRFLDYVAAHEDVWICRRIDIARHWMDRASAASRIIRRMALGITTKAIEAYTLRRTNSSNASAACYEHSPWVAELVVEADAAIRLARGNPLRQGALAEAMRGLPEVAAHRYA